MSGKKQFRISIISDGLIIKIVAYFFRLSNREDNKNTVVSDNITRELAWKLLNLNVINNVKQINSNDDDEIIILLSKTVLWMSSSTMPFCHLILS